MRLLLRLCHYDAFILGTHDGVSLFLKIFSTRLVIPSDSTDFRWLTFVAPTGRP